MLYENKFLITRGFHGGPTNRRSLGIKPDDRLAGRSLSESVARSLMRCKGPDGESEVIWYHMRTYSVCMYE